MSAKGLWRSRSRTALCFSLALPVLAALFLFPGAPARAEDRTARTEPVQQLRIYEIFESNKRAFHDRFRDHAARIMKKHGFRIVAMWEAKSDRKTEFVYLLSWPDETAMEESWARFMADEEWKRIKRETGAVHGQLVGGIEDRTLRLTSYSPRGFDTTAAE